MGSIIWHLSDQIDIARNEKFKREPTKKRSSIRKKLAPKIESKTSMCVMDVRRAEVVGSVGLECMPTSAKLEDRTEVRWNDDKPQNVEIMP